MNIEQHTIDAVSAELNVRLEPTDYSERFETALKNYRKQAQLPGFRPGHVPASLIKKRFGKALLAEEINTVLQESINKYIADNNLRVLGSPLPKDTGEVGDWENPAEFQFTYELGLAPEIDVPLDASQKFVYHKVDVNDDLINRQIKDYARRYGAMSNPEVSGAEDMVMVRLEELDGAGNVKEGGLIGQTTITIEYLKDDSLKSKLTGISTGQSVDLDPHSITGNHEELAQILQITHHDVHHLNSLFRATVTDIRRIEAAELNQELFDKLFPEGEITSEEQLRERVKGDLEKMFSRDSDWLFKRTFSREMVQRTPVQLPDGFLKKWIVFSSENPVTPEAVEHDYPMYADTMKWQLIENEIIRKYEIKVGMDDAMAHVKELYRERFASYGIPVDDERLAEMAKETLGKRDELRNVYDQLVETRIIELAKSTCSIEEKAMPYDDFVHMVQH